MGVFLLDDQQEHRSIGWGIIRILEVHDHTLSDRDNLKGRRCEPQVRSWIRWGHGCPSSPEAACGGPPLAYFEPVAGAGELGAGADEEGAGVEVVGAGTLLDFAGAVVLGAGVTAACVWAGRHSVALFFISHSTLRSLSRRPSPTLT